MNKKLVMRQRFTTGNSLSSNILHTRGRKSFRSLLDLGLFLHRKRLWNKKILRLIKTLPYKDKTQALISVMT